MGEVFRAVAVGESGFEKPVVVKRILPAHLGRSDLAELFIAEAKLMTRLAHPNIVEVLDFGRGEGRDYFLVLELVDGVDLARLHRSYTTRGERLPIPLTLFVVAQVLRGLHHAHAKSGGEGAWLVHRDVSPGNVLLSTVGEVKVADFGVALIARPDGVDRGPLAKGLVGKPQYMAPEQYDGDDVDPRADLFSVGVMLFFLLTDTFPFEGATLAEQQDAAHRGDFGRARDRRADVSPAIDALLRRALAPSPRDRFADAKTMGQAIEALRAEGQAIAGGDDVAAAVEAAQRAQPAPGRRVIALSGSAREPRDEDSIVERELTRTGAAGAVGSFTIRVAEGEALPAPPTTLAAREIMAELSATNVDRSSAPASPEPPAPPALRFEEPTEAPEIPLDRAPLPARALALIAVALVFLIAAGLGGRALLAGPATPLPSVSAEAPPRETSARLPVDSPTIAPSSTSSTSLPEPSARPVAPTPRSLAPRGSAVISVAPPTAAPADDCTGGVLFASTTSWTVSGGPQTVQTPGSYTWRCGTYALSAVSRVDARQRKHTTVTVRAGITARVDLR
jgi:eukaryotic-like serine/threonine-protein kinase